MLCKRNSQFHFYNTFINLLSVSRNCSVIIILSQNLSHFPPIWNNRSSSSSSRDLKNRGSSTAYRPVNNYIIGGPDKPEMLAMEEKDEKKLQLEEKEENKVEKENRRRTTEKVVKGPELVKILDEKDETLVFEKDEQGKWRQMRYEEENIILWEVNQTVST